MKTREEVAQELSDYFKDSVYWCERVPEAWGYGTMTLEDFTPAWGDDDILESILDVCEVPETAPTLADHIEAIKKYLSENNLPEMTKTAFLADLEEVKGLVK